MERTIFSVLQYFFCATPTLTLQVVVVHVCPLPPACASGYLPLFVHYTYCYPLSFNGYIALFFYLAHTFRYYFKVGLYFSDGESQSNVVKEGRPAWMRTLHGRCAEWLSLLPASLAPLRRTLDNIKDPLYRSASV